MKLCFQHRIWQSCIIILILYYVVAAELGNPYKILGVSRKATQLEIKKAYKQLAKEWHPDKTRNPQTAERFVEVNQAYELLSDPERRKKYDDKGITEHDSYQRPEYTSFYTSSPFDDIFAQHSSYFNFQENDITFFHKLSITTRQYDKIILPKSEKVPYLIFFYTDWCFQCLQTAPYCRKLIDYLEPLGVNFVTVHNERDPNLGRRLNIHTLPCLVFLLDGNVYVYKETITSIQKIIEFMKNKLPYKLVRKIAEPDVETFLNGWEDNRVRGLIFEPRQNIRLRYLITAFHFRHRVAFGFVDSSDVCKKYQIPYDMDTVLLFNENVTRPMASITMKDIPTSTLHHIIASNQYLALPRLSSQAVLDSVCPYEWNRKRLCVVLVTEASSSHEEKRQSFRLYAQNAPYSLEKVRFAYIYHDKQVEFVNSLIPEGEYFEPILSIVIFWRKDTSHIKYEWITEKWEGDKNFTDTTHELNSAISRLLKTSEALSYDAFVKDLLDEHAQSMAGRILTKAINFAESTFEGMGKEHILPAASLVGTVICIVIVGYFMVYLVKIEEASIQQQKAEARSGNNNNDSSSSTYQPELKLHELRAEKYNGLVRLLKPGCRTVLLLLDMESRRHLIPPFHRAVWPYRKNKTLMFSFMYIERGLGWYKELLQLSLPDERELNINPRNCVGTVLSLNGHRKYFCMFHAKHTEKNKHLNGFKRSVKQADEKDCESGAFIGFESDSSDSEEEILLQGHLLDGLSNWLDRLFEGTTQRYHINYWPEFPCK